MCFDIYKRYIKESSTFIIIFFLDILVFLRMMILILISLWKHILYIRIIMSLLKIRENEEKKVESIISFESHFFKINIVSIF